jgi:hypothetical protein
MRFIRPKLTSPMTRNWLLLAVVCFGACDAGTPSPYGNKPHIMGRAGVLSVHGTLAEAQRTFPELGAEGGVGDFVDGTMHYRVFFTPGGRVETIYVYMPGKLSDLEAGWGRGTRGTFGGGSADFYFNAAEAVVYVAFAGESQFVVAARPYLPLSKVWDDGHDIRVFGLDLLGKPIADDVAALAALGLEGMPTVDDDKHVLRSTGSPMSDAGAIEWSLESNENTRVTKLTVVIGPYEVPSNVPAMDALFVEKWGKPTMVGRQMRFPVEPHQIVEFHDKDIWITE